MSVPENVWRSVILPQNASIKEAINKLNETGLQIILVIEKDDLLQGTVTDGDIRRAILSGLPLEATIDKFMRRNSFVVPSEISREMVQKLMYNNKIRQMPIVDANQKLLGLHLWHEVTMPVPRMNRIIIMAGGQGTRMRPHTENCPKPMLLVAGKPILEHIILRAKEEGFSRFIISLGYLGHVIEKYFANGERLGVQIEYIKEVSPLGTAGALALLKSTPDLPFLVVNGDVLSDIKYSELLDFHSRNSASATMAVRIYEWQNPFGVVQTNGINIVGFEEKPITRTHINAGIYVINSETLDSIIVNEYCDMPTFFEKLKLERKRIIAYPMHEPWLDIGRPTDLDYARNINSMIL